MTCTYENSRKAASLKVVKKAAPLTDPATKFSYTVAGGGTPASFDLAPTTAAGASQDVAVTPAVGGTKYTITEASLAEWKLDKLDCVGASGKTITLDQGKAEVTIKPGDNVTCTYENSPKAASLKVVKKAAPLTDPATKFSYTVAGGGTPASFDLAPTTAAGASQDVAVTPAVGGTKYTITEASLAEWKLDKLDCVGASGKTITLDQGKAEVTIKPGDNVTCTYENSPKAASLKVVKKAAPLTDPATKFSYTVAGGGTPASFDLAPTTAAGASQDVAVTPAVGGTKYTITEASLAEWKLDKLDCVGASGKTITLDQGKAEVTIKPGDNVTCTYENSPKAASLKVVKKAAPLTDPATKFSYTVAGSGTPASFDLAPTTAAGASQDVAVTPAVGGTKYTITEASLAEWKLDKLDCCRRVRQDHHPGPGQGRGHHQAR